MTATSRFTRSSMWLCEAALPAIIVVAGFCASAHASVILNTQIQFTTAIPPIPGTTYTATTEQVGIGVDPTAVWFNFAGVSLTLVTTALDEGSDWYLVNPGDVFSPATIAAGQFTIVFEPHGPNYLPGPVVSIPLGDFYLGVATTDPTAPPWPGPSFRNVFGWLELHNTGTELIPVANAVAYNEPGIIIGTTTPAPEPASLVMLAGPVVFLAATRRRRPGASC